MKSDDLNGIYELDGSFIVDYPSFFLAIGEAINGPRGYFGGCLDSLDDCCLGGFGAVPPFKLIWRDHLKSRETLTMEAWKNEFIARGGEYSSLSPSSNFFDAIIELLEDRGIELILK